MKDFKDFTDSRLSDAALRVEKEYAGKSESDIFGEILSRAEKGKREGTLTNADIDRFYSALSPSLTAAQRKKLKKVVEDLKKI